MPSFDVSPTLTLSSSQDVSAAVNVSWAHGDNTIKVTLADSMVQNGVSTDGLKLKLSNDRFEVGYDVSNNAPCLKLNTHVTLQDKRVDLVYRNAIKAGSSSLEAKVSVDDNNSASLTYDLSNFNAPSHRDCSVKWTYTSGDLELSPAYNLGSESLSVGAKYSVDADNSLKINYDLNSSDASLEWTNTAAAGGGGDLVVTATTNLADSNAAKQMPTIKLEKTWTIDG
jgi:hypothetical protein